MIGPRIDRWLFAAAVILGLGFIVNATLIGALDLGGERYRYHAIEGSIDDGTVRFQRLIESEGRFDVIEPRDVAGVDCWYRYERARLCAFEERLLDREGATARSEADRIDAAVAPYVRLDGAFYRRVPLGSGGLNRVTPRSMLADLAVEPASLGPAARQAVASGSTAARQPLPAEGQIVGIDGGYVVLVDRPLRKPNLFVILASRGIQVVTGFALLAWGWRSLWREHWESQLPDARR